MSRVWLAVAWLVLAPSIARADAPAIAAASGKLAALDYEGALHLLDATWRAGGNAVADAGRIAELAARAAASLDDMAAARHWYRTWLCVDPKAALPDGTSPALEAAFDAARSELGAHWLRAEAQRTADAITVTVVDDPCGQAAAARAGEHRAALHDGAATLRSTAGAIDIVDGYGNALATVAVVSSEAHRSWYGRPLTWGIAGGAAAVLGAVSFYIAVDARDQLRSLAATSAASSGFYDGEPASLQQRFDRANVAGTLLVGGAVIAAGVAVVLWIREPARAVRPRATGETIGWSVAF